MTLEAQGALGPYSAVVAEGRFVFLSGKIGTRSASFTEEAASAVDAIERELARLELGLEHVVQATVYLTDMALYGELNEVWASRFPRPFPARTCVGVAGLPGGARIEIQALARRP